MKKINDILKRIVNDHHTVIFIGIMLIIMGLISLSENLLEKVFGLHFEIAYGFIFLGIFNILLALAFIIMGAMNIEAGMSSNDDNPLKELENRVRLLEEKIQRKEGQ